MKRVFLTPLLAALVTLTVAACGTSKTDRALSGAGIGAAGGAVTGALVGGSAAGGALIGGLGGAAVGAATDSDDVDLGKPVWR